MRLVIDCCIQIIKNMTKNLPTQKEKITYLEQISDLFSSIILTCHCIDGENDFGVLRLYRQKIIDLFNNENFFELESKYNFSVWKGILNNFTLNKRNLDDLFKDWMERWSSNQGIFAKNVKLRCNNMQRIAFLIFSCSSDRFESQQLDNEESKY